MACAMQVINHALILPSSGNDFEGPGRKSEKKPDNISGLKQISEI